MPKHTIDEESLKASEHLIGYFESSVLLFYRNEPNKYIIEETDFGGRITITEQFYSELEQQDSNAIYEENIDILFGYRDLDLGHAVAVWLPHLRKSKKHLRRWSGFHLESPTWSTGYGENFVKWVKRYIEGTWDVENGVLADIKDAIETINAITNELVNLPLYKFKIDEGVSYPFAENSHSYQDAHGTLYRYLVDGLNKDCIKALDAQIGKSTNINSDKTIQAICKVFPQLENQFKPSMELISEQRRLASHGERPTATTFAAHTQFEEDLENCLTGINELMSVLETKFTIDGQRALKRYQAKEYLPPIDQERPPESHFAINRATNMVGKTIDKVEFGFHEKIKNTPETEVLIIYFSDGSIMSITIGANLNIIDNLELGISPEDFSFDLMLNWVDSL